MDWCPQLKWPYSVVIFWPTVVIARLWAYFFPQQRRIWDAIPNTPLVVGAVPLLSHDFQALQDMGVTAVVNMCAEWEPDSIALSSHKMRSLHVPVVDMSPPSQTQLVHCVRWISEHVHSEQESSPNRTSPLVYVHCKAGRGRSVLVAAACLMVWSGMTPAQASATIRAVRPHASDKSKHTALLQLHEELSKPSSHTALQLRQVTLDS